MPQFDYGRFVNRLPADTDRRLATALADVFRDLALDQAPSIWTPTLTAATPGNLSVVYTVQLGALTRINSYLAQADFTLTCTPTYTTASGALIISGLPMTAVAITNYDAVGAAYVTGVTLPAGFTAVCTRVTQNTSNINVVRYGSASTATNVLITDVPTGTAFTVESSIVIRI